MSVPSSSVSGLHVGFLFNHDATHQVAHIAPIIAALREHHPEVHVLALTSSEEQARAVRDVVARLTDRGFACVPLQGARWLRRLFSLTNAVPAERIYTLWRHRRLFEHLDCLVVPEMTSARLKARGGLAHTALVLLPHGAGDRAVGFGTEIRAYDFVMLAGTKVRDRMLAGGLIREDNHRVVGYPKFDLPAARGRARLFDNDRPTVLYNPHFEPRLSSWYRMGEAVLEFFAEQTQYNLVVAPHVMLFRRRLQISLGHGRVRRVRPVPARFRDCPNILVDAGSERCVDMTYTANADVYLGDVSSQVYEFLQRPRPCLFLDANRTAWQNDENYRHWRLGPVLQSVGELDAALRARDTIASEYRTRQEQAFAETFALSDTPSAPRAAQALVDFLAARMPATSPHGRVEARRASRAARAAEHAW